MDQYEDPTLVKLKNILKDIVSPRAWYEVFLDHCNDMIEEFKMIIR